MTEQTVPTAADLRAAIARSGIAKWRVAQAVGIHPQTLGQILAEHQDLPGELSRKILAVLEENS